MSLPDSDSIATDGALPEDIAVCGERVPSDAPMHGQPALPVHAAQEVEHQREHNAEQDRGGQGEVEGEVAAAIEDVAGQTTDGELGAPEQHDQQSDRDQDRAQNNDELAQVEHDLILTPP